MLYIFRRSCIAYNEETTIERNEMKKKIVKFYKKNEVAVLAVISTSVAALVVYKRVGVVDVRSFVDENDMVHLRVVMSNGNTEYFKTPKDRFK